MNKARGVEISRTQSEAVIGSEEARLPLLTDLPIRLADAADEDVVLRTVTLAFSADPVARWINPDLASYLEVMPKIVSAFVGNGFAAKSIFVAGDGEGVAAWLPPEVGLDEERLGAVITEHVASPVREDLMSVFEQMGKFHPEGPHWYLPCIGVDPRWQGQGIGSRLMAHALERCDAVGVAAYLESSNPRNIELYQRHGFEIVGTIQAGTSPSIVPMIREARPRGRHGKTVSSGKSPGTREAWDRIAPGYDKTNTETQMWLAGEALRHAELQPGTRFLDVACGSGALAIPAARAGADVFAVDQSTVMLKLLRERSRKGALAVESSVMDGHALEFEDNSFDIAGSQFGVMLFPDMPRGIREMARVVRPGGTVLVIAYGDPGEIDFLHYLVEAVQSVRPEFEGPPMDPPPLPFQLSDPERLQRELEVAGLNEVRVETIIERTAFSSGSMLWNWIIWSNPIVEEVLGELSLSETERDTVRGILHRKLQERADDSGQAYLTNPINIGIGRK